MREDDPLRREAAAPQHRGRGGPDRFAADRRRVHRPHSADTPARGLLPGAEPAVLRRRAVPFPPEPGRRPAHPGRGTGPDRETGSGRGHGLPVPPGGQHPHVGPRRGLRRDRLPHRHDEEAHSGGSEDSRAGATATPTTWRTRSGRPRTRSTRSGTPPSSGTSSHSGTSSTATCSNSRPWTTSSTARTPRS